MLSKRLLIKRLRLQAEQLASENSRINHTLASVHKNLAELREGHRRIQVYRARKQRKKMIQELQEYHEKLEMELHENTEIIDELYHEIQQMEEELLSV